MSARAFVWRWSWRMVRKELRQYLVILIMIATGVAAAAAGVLVTYNMVEAPESTYGNGQIEVDSPTPDALAQELQTAGIEFGVVQHGLVERDGQRGTIELRAADPTNVITEPLFALRDGRWPSNDNEIAVSDRALADQPPIGATVAIDGRTVEIVGVVENPNRLSEEFVYTTTPSAFDPERTRFMVDASVDQLFNAVTVDVGASENGPSDRAVLTILVNVVVAFGMVEVALLVGSAFSVIAKRRTRQYGLLASAGATPAMVRRAAASSGAIVGLMGTAIGLTIGLVVGRGLVPALEPSVDRRIDFAYPLLALLPTVVLGVAVATLGARRPAKALKRASVASLLSAARPKPEPVGRAALLGVVLAAAGAALLITGFRTDDGLFAVLGTLLAPVGLLLLAPLLVKLLGRVAGRLPLSERLAGRSIARYNRRSASTVAALALALAVPVGLSVVTTSIDQRAENRPPNLADNQLVVWGANVSGESATVPAVDKESLDAAVAALADVAPGLSFTPLQVDIPAATPSHTSDDGVSYQYPLMAGELVTDGVCNFCSVRTIGWGGDSEYMVTPSYVATPELLNALGLDSDWIAEGKTAIAAQSGLVLIDDSIDSEGDAIRAADDQIAVSESWPAARSLPSMLHSPEFADGNPPTTIGWLAISDGPLDEATIAAVVGADLESVELELPAPPDSRWALRSIGLAIGGLLALGITASAVVLLISELSRDSALLASLGASPRTGQRMSASIAGLLAFIGALLAVLIGYLPLTPMISAKVDEFPFVVPWPTLLALLVVFPLMASGLGWSLSRKSAGGRDLRDFI